MNMFKGQDCWHTGKPWTPEDFCVPGERLIADMDATGIDKAGIKLKIRELKRQRDEALAQANHDLVRDVRRHIHHLNHQIRSHVH